MKVIVEYSYCKADFFKSKTTVKLYSGLDDDTGIYDTGNYETVLPDWWY